MIVLIPYNKLEVNLNFKNIDRDFYTYEVSKPENKWFRKSFFDFPVSEMKARSVVYEYGPSFFVLFNKSGLSAEEIRRQLEAQDADARIRRLDQNALTALPTHLSTQLILNTLNSCDDFEGRSIYNNITGGLYYHARYDDKEDAAVTLHLKLNRDMVLQMTVATFSKIGTRKLDAKAEYLPRYQYVPEYGRLISITNRHDVPRNECYIRRSFAPRPNTLEYLSFNRNKLDEYGLSKVGILCRFLDDVKEHLSDYITSVSVEALPDYEEVSPKEENATVDFGQLVGSEVNIINLIDEDLYGEEIEVFCEIIESKYGVSVSFGDYRPDAYNLVIIHNQKYYLKNKLPDPHEKVWPGVVQHVTWENFLKKVNKSQFLLMVKKTLQDLLIKKDIQDNRMSLVNLNLSHSWTFVMVGEKTEEGKNWTYYKMTVRPSGELNFETFEHKTFMAIGSDKQRIDALYERYARLPGYGYNIESLFYLDSDIDNAFILSKTDARPLPLYDEMDKMLRLTNPSNLISKDMISGELDVFLEQHEEYRDIGQVESLRTNLSCCQSTRIGIKDVVQYLKLSTQFMQEFNTYLFDSIGFPLTPIFKYKNNKEKYFAGFVGLKYYIQDGKLYYFVGGKDYKDIKTSFARSNVIRRVDSAGGTLSQEFIHTFFDFLTVDFIRENQFTVIPFPLKYLREYITMCRAKGTGAANKTGV